MEGASDITTGITLSVLTLYGSIVLAKNVHILPAQECDNGVHDIYSLLRRNRLNVLSG